MHTVFGSVRPYALNLFSIEMEDKFSGSRSMWDPDGSKKRGWFQFNELSGGFVEWSPPAGLLPEQDYNTFAFETNEAWEDVTSGWDQFWNSGDEPRPTTESMTQAFDDLQAAYKRQITGLVPRHVIKPLEYVYQTITKTDTESVFQFQYDSIVFTSGKMGVDLENACKNNLGGDVDPNCNFNELFICSAMRDFTSTTGISNPYSFNTPSLRDGFFREFDHTWDLTPGWGVTPVTYIRVGNPHIVVKYKTGLHDSQCGACQQESCSSGEMRWDAGARERGYMEYHGSEGSATCFWFELVPDANGLYPSCDTRSLTHGDANLRDDNRGVVQLPNYIDTSVETRSPLGTQFGVQFDEASSLNEARTITACPASFMYELTAPSTYDKPYEVSRCVPAECNPDLRSNCMDANMAAMCASRFGSADEQEICMYNEITTCRLYKSFESFKPLRTIDDCKKKKENGMYYDMVSGSEQECAKSQAYGRGDGADVYEQEYFECGGAYQGRIVCGQNPDALGQVTLPREWIADTETSCLSCTICDATDDPPRFYQYGCESWFGKARGVDGFQLHSHDSVCVDCATGECSAGEWRDCSGIPIRDRLEFEEDSSVAKNPSCKVCTCNDQQEGSFCLVNTTVCDGRSLINEGAVVTDLNRIQCPPGQFRDPDAVLDEAAYLDTDTGMAAILAHVCRECVHADPSGVCSPGETWLGCPGFGTVGNPSCTACPGVDPNIVWNQATTAAKECRFRCTNNFIKDTTTKNIATDTVCSDCYVNRPVTCAAGSYLTTCDGSEQVPSCALCGGKIPNAGCTQAGEFLLKCPGTGYASPAVDWQNTCSPCAPGPGGNEDATCPATQEWKPCDALFKDNSECVTCATPDNSVLALTVGITPCGFYCDAGYYKAKKSDTDNTMTCRECTLELDQICGPHIQGCTYEGCNGNATEDTRCVCEPGFGWSEDGTGQAVSPCTPCLEYFYSPGGRAPCSACPLGYGGNKPTESTSCLPCAVDTYRAKDETDLKRRPMLRCEACIAGTGGVSGSNVCKSCKAGSGFLAIENLTVSNRWVFNHVAGSGNNPWHEWFGTAPTSCFVHGASTATLQICRDMDYTTIRVKDNGKVDVDDPGQGVGERETGGSTPEFYCGACANGLAYSTTWKSLDQVFETIEGFYGDNDAVV
jgi:hypothetical protein